MSSELNFLSSLEFFSGLSEEILEDLAQHCTQVVVPAGQIVFRSGDVSDALYVVSIGRLIVSIQQEDDDLEGNMPLVVHEAGRGQMVGEMGLLTGESRSATVSSARDSVLLRLSKDSFEQVVERHPSLALRIARDLAQRLRRSNTRTTIRPYNVKTFAVMPAGEIWPIRSFVEPLLRALDAIGPVRRITKALVEECVGCSDMTDRRVIHWLDEQEERFAYVLYEADPSLTDWTSRCIRQADRILTVSAFENNRQLNEIEREFVKRDRDSRAAGNTPGRPKIDLVLLHKERSFSPVNTLRWLSDRSVEQHHHVSINSAGDMKRLATALTGKAFGLVLGGGGARGFAHIGALKAIDEAGLTLECIGGTSQGALIGAQYAMGLTSDEMIAMNKRLFKDFRPFKGDVTVPVFAFLTGATTNKGLQQLFGDRHISDLKIPFFCVSANLSLAKLMVQQNELVWKALRCSLSLPVLMPPVVQKGQLIVDGGVLNNFPVDIMRNHCDGRIIAVDVSPPVDLLADSDDRYTLTFSEFLRRKLSRKKRGAIPHLLEILMRTAFLSSIHHRQAIAKYADLLVHPPMAGYSLLDWDHLETLVEVGYKATQETLKTWTGLPRPKNNVENPCEVLQTQA